MSNDFFVMALQFMIFQIVFLILVITASRTLSRLLNDIIDIMIDIHSSTSRTAFLLKTSLDPPIKKETNAFEATEREKIKGKMKG